jgi:hypothetical protein
MNDSLSFNDRCRLLKTTDGDLRVHARKLQKARDIARSKFLRPPHFRAVFRLPRNRCCALENSIEQMETT